MEYTKLEKWLLPTGWRKDAVLEWKQAQEAWRIPEAKSRSLKRLFLWTALFFLLCFLAFTVIVWLDEAPFSVIYQLLFSFSISVGSIAVASVIWWYAAAIMTTRQRWRRL